MVLCANCPGLSRKSYHWLLLFSAWLLLAGCATTLPVDYVRIPSVAFDIP